MPTYTTHTTHTTPTYTTHTTHTTPTYTTPTHTTPTYTTDASSEVPSPTGSRWPLGGHRRSRGCALLLISLALGATGCSSVIPTAPKTVNAASTNVSAKAVMAAFKSDKLPVTRISDITGSCAGILEGCAELIVADKVSVYRFNDDAAAAAFAAVGGTHTDRDGAVVLSFGSDTLDSYTRARFITVVHATLAQRPVPKEAPRPVTLAERKARQKKVALQKKATRSPNEQRCRTASQVIEQTRTDLKAFQFAPMAHLAIFPKQLSRHLDTFDDTLLPGARGPVSIRLDVVRDDLSTMRTAVRSVNQNALRSSADQLSSHARQLHDDCSAPAVKSSTP